LRILGIETSCDETAVAVLEDGHVVRADLISSQVDLHRKYGGVVPEIASQRHIETIGPLVREALAVADCAADRLDAVAVTTTPGLIGALLVGTCFARSFAYALQIPVVPIHHIEGHIAAVFLEHRDIALPAVALVASGGHTDLYRLDPAGEYHRLGRTVDDAAGEAFDKGARLLGLDYPGGPAIDRASEGGDPKRIRFPRPRTAREDDFSFSGLKSALARRRSEEPDDLLADLAASYQEAIVDVLVTKTVRAAMREQARAILLVGGVAANRLLRRRMSEEGTRRGLATYIPAPRYCTDNAVMIAMAAALRQGRGSPLSEPSPVTTRGVQGDHGGSPYEPLPITTR